MPRWVHLGDKDCQHIVSRSELKWGSAETVQNILKVRSFTKKTCSGNELLPSRLILNLKIFNILDLCFRVSRPIFMNCKRFCMIL